MENSNSMESKIEMNSMEFKIEMAYNKRTRQQQQDQTDLRRRLLSTSSAKDLRRRQWRSDATELAVQAASFFSPTSFLPHASLLPRDSNDITAAAV
ncbi:uncharacterized protein DS421_20g694900 [Arachis hypogaea]|nr:uncharacterized protein DS421_20g694900 [Arachis hypogaea]